MYSLSKVREPLACPWLKSVLLHGVLLLCAVLYHLHIQRSSHFSTNRFDKADANAMMIASHNNIDFLELSFEDTEMTEQQQTAQRLEEQQIDASTDVLLDPLLDEPLDSFPDAPIDLLIDAPIPAPVSKNITTEVVTARALQSAVLRVQAEKQAVSSRSSLQRVAPASATAPSAQASALPITHTSPSTSHVATQALVTARPDHAHSPKPDYPLVLRDLGISGVVWLRVWVDDTGRPKEIELAKGSGYRLFDEAALRAVQHWRFIPAKSEQQSLASWVVFAVRFELNG